MVAVTTCGTFALLLLTHVKFVNTFQKDVEILINTHKLDFSVSGGQILTCTCVFFKCFLSEFN